MNIKLLLSIFLAALITFTLCSCNTLHNGENANGGDTLNANPDFPCVPDRIIIGCQGEEKEILPGDEAFDRIVSSTEWRCKDDDGFATALLYTDSGKNHIANKIRQTETFVEYVYDEPTVQVIKMETATGMELEEISPMRIFFSLTGENHHCLFLSDDADYESGLGTYGVLGDDTDFITYVTGLFSSESEAT